MFGRYFKIKKTLTGIIEGRLQAKFEQERKSWKKKDPLIDKKRYNLFWGLFKNIHSSEFSKYSSIMALTLPIFFGVMVFALSLGLLNSHIPASSIIAVILLGLLFLRTKKIIIPADGYKIVHVIRHILNQKDAIESKNRESLVKKFGNPRGLWYVLVLITTVLATYLMFIICLTITSMVLQNNELSITYRIISAPLFTLGVFPFVISAYCSLVMLLSNKTNMKKIPRFCFPWIIVSGFLWIILKFEIPELSWLLAFNFEHMLERSIILGGLGTGALVHFILMLKSDKLSIKITQKNENILAITLSVIPVFVLSVNGNILLGLASVVLPSWLWYSGVSTFKYSSHDQVLGKHKISVYSLVSCLSVIGVYLWITESLWIASFCFIGAGFGMLLSLSEQRKDRIGKILFGITEITD